MLVYLTFFVSSDVIHQRIHTKHRTTSRTRRSCMIFWNSYGGGPKTKIINSLMNLSINDIRIFPIIPKDGIVAFASAVIDECFYIGSIAIHEKKNISGYRITYPTRKSRGKDLNLYHPLTNECSELIEKAIIQAYLISAKTVIYDWYGRSDSTSTPFSSHE